MNYQEPQPSPPAKNHLDFILLALGLFGLLWLTSRMTLQSQSIILLSVLPGPVIALLGMGGKKSLPPAQKRNLVLGLCVLSLGIACTVVGITRFPEHLPIVSASGIAAVGLYLVRVMRRMGKTATPAAA